MTLSDRVPIFSLVAAKITHIEVLKQASILLEHGSTEQQDLAEMLGRKKYLRYAGLGAVAPDIFYFYHIFQRKKARKAQYWGNALHHRRVFEFVQALLDHARQEEDLDRKWKKMAFALGYLCHCAVDIVTHPYIFYITGDYYSNDAARAEEAQINHLRVEYTLDAYLIHERWRLHPHQYHFLQYADCRERGPNGLRLDLDIWQMLVESLQRVFKNDFAEHYIGSAREIVPGDIINESFLGFLRFNRVVDSRFFIVRLLLRLIDFLTFRRLKIRNLILPVPAAIDRRLANEENRLWKYPGDPSQTSSESFMDLVHRAGRASADAMTEAYLYLQGRANLKDLRAKYHGFNLDTGLRSESIEMVEFDVIPDNS